MNDLTTAQLQRLLTIQRQIERLQKEKAAIMGGAAASTGRRTLSAATKKKLSQKLKAVWAKRKHGSLPG